MKRLLLLFLLLPIMAGAQNGWEPVQPLRQRDPVVTRGAEPVYDSTTIVDGSSWTQFATGTPPTTNAYNTQGHTYFLNNTFYKVNEGGVRDVWSSSDASSWTRISTNHGMTTRSESGRLVFDNKMWVIGGNSMSDVWHSTNGVDWTRVSTSAPVNRRSAAYGVHRGKMWVAGGYTSGALNTTVYNSSDGVTWDQTTSLSSSRWCAGHLLSFKDKLYLIGGTVTGADSQNTVYATTDGSAWSAVTYAANFPAVQMHETFTDGVNMWIVGGRYGTMNTRSYYVSADGASWVNASPNMGWGGWFPGVAYGHPNTIYSTNYYSESGGAVVSNVWKSGNSIITTNNLTQQSTPYTPNKLGGF